MYIPQKNEYAETATLGSVLMDKNVIQNLQDMLQADDFYITKHQKIFSTMCKMHTKEIPIDVVTIIDCLKSKGWHEEIGGYSYLINLIELTPSSANYKHYAKKVKEASRLRKISEFSLQIKQDIDEGKIDFLSARNVISDFNDDISKEDSDEGIIRLSDEPEPDERKWILEDFIPMGFPTTLYSTGGGRKILSSNFLSN